MDKPTIFGPYHVAPDIDVLPAYFPIPGLGILPVNAFVLKAAEPVLVDTGLVPLSDEFMEKLSSIIDLDDLRWVWLTHNDQDHIGSLQRVIQEAPKLRIITSFLGMGKMSLFQPLPLDRVHLLNPGQSLSVGDRTLIALKPPAFDAPETIGFFDPKTAAFFCSDCFGTLMSEPVEKAVDIGSTNLRKGLLTWATVDFPWLHMVDRALFEKTLNRVREISPKIILSSHLPAAHGMTEELLEYLADVPEAEPFIGPDQQALETMLSELSGDS
jgi:flavorubredoxin